MWAMNYILNQLDPSLIEQGKAHCLAKTEVSEETWTKANENLLQIMAEAAILKSTDLNYTLQTYSEISQMAIQVFATFPDIMLLQMYLFPIFTNGLPAVGYEWRDFRVDLQMPQYHVGMETDF